MGIFSIFKKKRKVPYIPQGRVGYFRKSSSAWKYIIIMEEIGRIGVRSQVKILIWRSRRFFGD